MTTAQPDLKAAANQFITTYTWDEDVYEEPFDAMNAAFKAGAKWAQPAQPTIPDGMRLVPIEPTPEIIAAMAVCEATGQINGVTTVGMYGAEEAWEAIIALTGPDAHLKATAEDMEIYKDCAKSVQPAKLMQDDSRGLSKWLSSTPNAKQEAREIAHQITLDQIQLLKSNIELR